MLPGPAVDPHGRQGKGIGAAERFVGRPCIAADGALPLATEFHALVTMDGHWEGPSEFFAEVGELLHGCSSVVVVFILPPSGCLGSSVSSICSRRRRQRSCTACSFWRMIVAVTGLICFRK